MAFPITRTIGSIWLSRSDLSVREGVNLDISLNLAFFFGRWANYGLFCSQMGLFFADALHYIGQVCLTVLRYPRKRFHRLRLRLMIYLSMITSFGGAFSRIIPKKFTALAQPRPRYKVFLRQWTIDNGYACVALSFICHLSSRKTCIGSVFFLNAALTRRMCYRITFNCVVRWRCLLLITLIRAYHGADVRRLGTTTLGWPLDSCLWAQAFTLDISVSTFWILRLLSTCTDHLIWAAMNGRFGSVFVTIIVLKLIRSKIYTFGAISALGREGTRRVHTHFEFSWDLEGTNLAKAILIFSSLLLVTRCKFKSATTS